MNTTVTIRIPLPLWEKTKDFARLKRQTASKAVEEAITKHIINPRRRTKP